MNIVNLFPQAVLETQLENWDQCREEIFKQVELSSGDIEFSNDIVLASNSFISTNILKKCPITTAQLNANLQQYADTIGVESLKICDSWVSKYEYNEYLSTHRHSPKHVSGVIFLTDGFQGGDFYFENPVVDLDHILLNEHYAKFNSYNEPLHVIKPIMGKLIIFRSLLSHGTTPLSSNTIRYSLAFNAMVGK